MSQHDQDDTSHPDADLEAGNGSDSSIAPLRIPTFRRLWIGLIIFNLGHLILVVASSWLILEITNSPFWVSLMVAAPTLPLLFLSLPAGAAADLLNRRHVLVASSAMLGVASLGMSLIWVLDMVTPGRLVGLGLAIGIGIAFFNPAWQAIVPSLVPSSLVPGAVSLNSATGGVATALGPAVGGLLVATVGPGWSFAVATVGYLSILLTTLASKTLEWNKEKGSMSVAIATGLRYLRFSDNYLWLLLLGSLFGFTAAALRSMLPNITSDALGGDSALYGTLLGLFGAGALLGGLTRSIAGRAVGTRMIAVSIVAFGVSSGIVGVSTSVTLTGIAIAVAGLLWTWILSTLISIYQMLTPDWVRGRTMGAFILSVFGFMPLGSVTSGTLGDAIGASGSLLVFSAGVMAVGLATFKMPIPILEHIEPPVVPEPTIGNGVGDEPNAEAVMVTNTWTIAETEFEPFVEFLAELRRLRLKTGAYEWAVYRSAADLSRVTEVFMLHSWEQHLQQHRRLDVQALRTIARMRQFGDPESFVQNHWVEFDVDDPDKRPAWRDLLSEHEEFHLPHVSDPHR